MENDSWIIRNYVPGDELALVPLWNLAYAEYSGFVPRSIEYWRWCILERPGVCHEDIIILEIGGRPLAYGVLGPKGDVLEFVVNNFVIKDKKREKIANHLLMAIEERSRKRGDEKIRFVLPYIDKSLRRVVLRFTNYKETKGQFIHLGIIDLPRLLERLLQSHKKRLPENWSPTFILEINAAYKTSKYDYRLMIRLRPHISVELIQNNRTGVVTLVTEIATLTRLIFDQVKFEEALKGDLISIDPVQGQKDVKTLIDLLVVNRPWYVPLADIW